MKEKQETIHKKLEYSKKNKEQEKIRKYDRLFKYINEVKQRAINKNNTNPNIK